MSIPGPLTTFRPRCPPGPPATRHQSTTHHSPHFYQRHFRPLCYSSCAPCFICLGAISSHGPAGGHTIPCIVARVHRSPKLPALKLSIVGEQACNYYIELGHLSAGSCVVTPSLSTRTSAADGLFRGGATAVDGIHIDIESISPIPKRSCPQRSILQRGPVPVMYCTWAHMGADPLELRLMRSGLPTICDPSWPVALGHAVRASPESPASICA